MKLISWEHDDCVNSWFLSIDGNRIYAIADVAIRATAMAYETFSKIIEGECASILPREVWESARAGMPTEAARSNT